MQELQTRQLLPLKALCAQIRVDRHTIERAVHSTWGGTFRQLRQQLILKRSVDLFISKPTATIEEIARELGYCSGGAFGRAFKRAYGLSPSEYRRRMLGGASRAGDQPTESANPAQFFAKLGGSI
jgi:AraC-like DNA-binding protein